MNISQIRFNTRLFFAKIRAKLSFLPLGTWASIQSTKAKQAHEKSRKEELRLSIISDVVSYAHYGTGERFFEKVITIDTRNFLEESGLVAIFRDSKLDIEFTNAHKPLLMLGEQNKINMKVSW